MSGYEYAFTLTPGGSSRARSLTIACAAIAAVCVLSSAVVMRELVGAQPAAAMAPSVAATTAASAPAATTAPAATIAPNATTARTWALEPRWWQGEIRQIVRGAAIIPDSELTFTKGYQLRLAARQGTQPADPPAQVATTAPSAQTKPSRPGATVRNAPTVVYAETPEIRRASATRAEPPADPFARFNVGTPAMAYDEKRSSERGFADIRRAPARGFFGMLY